MAITRRDFLNGVAITIAAGLTPLDLVRAAGKAGAVIHGEYYPPALTGLRGNHPGSFEMAHALGREHENFALDGLPIEEEYDLVIVGGGISGLAAACFWQQLAGKESKILVLDNHDDFGGHAKRNEFTVEGKTLIGYGGSEAFQSPANNFSPVVNKLMADLGISVSRMKAGFDVNFYPDHQLSRGVFFDKKHFGETKIVSGDPGRAVSDDIPHDRLNGRPIEAFINDFPLSEEDRKALITLHVNPSDYLPGMTVEEKSAWLDGHSYHEFLSEKVGLSKMALLYFQQRSNDFFAIGIEGISCADARACALPGMEGMGLPPLDGEALADLEEPYVYHFPDGNAGLTRLMIRHLIPQALPGSTMEDSITSRLDYSTLDKPQNPARIRLNSVVVNAANTDDGVVVTYLNDGKPHRVRGRNAVMAGYNMMVPYLVPETPEEQKDDLRLNVKAPLVYTNVVVKNWQPFMKLGIHEFYSPAAPYSRVKLDYPVSLGSYQHPQSPDEPMVLHMVYVPTYPGSNMSAREQFRKGRAFLLGTSFDAHEKMIRDQLQEMLGSAGFDHERDIAAITVNRWAHGYAYYANALFDDMDKQAEIVERARKPVGRIAIANSDSDWSAYAHAAIDQAWRAVNELKAMG
ncbi:putative NAD(P)-binding protein [Yokenella regensburgei]|jgi:spermidine dehydrogenase|uniref:NAD(P)-binding protein n=1 Tax=Yokenella regensburgei TaxID=158877 RepID=A0ABX9RV09_9ENTR|nr:NAD(P)/FAD-dependent oxidoreductase [Yokenella regensburgei]QIU91534.1 NAD(P)-binding protein [Yokenella regensburgei]RKR53859.1 putative NAD(P)-binding protein [Yokenella regensburgei]VFS30043.1 Protoporphyrinogen oxidase [Yokenella regensburgei]